MEFSVGPAVNEIFWYSHVELSITYTNFLIYRLREFYKIQIEKNNNTSTLKIQGIGKIINKITPFLPYNYWLRGSDTQLTDPTKQKVPRVVKVMK